MEEEEDISPQSSSSPSSSFYHLLVSRALLWGEGYLLAAIVVCGIVSNVFLQVLIRNRELNLIKDFSNLLQMQATYDVLYLVCNIPAFVVPALMADRDRHQIVPLMPAVLPLLHIFLTGSCYTTLALATERLSAMHIVPIGGGGTSTTRTTTNGIHRPQRRGTVAGSVSTSNSSLNGGAHQGHNQGCQGQGQGHQFLNGGGQGHGQSLTAAAPSVVTFQNPSPPTTAVSSGARTHCCSILCCCCCCLAPHSRTTSTSVCRARNGRRTRGGGIWVAAITVLALSFAVNFPRFFEMRVGRHKETILKRVNSTGIAALDHQLITRTLPHLEAAFSSSYFVYYNQLFSFLALTFAPSLALTVLNTLIYRRLQAFQSVTTRLGREARRTVRATVSLVCIVLFHLVCHSFKVAVNGYQLVQILSAGSMVYLWPWWVELLTVASHVALAANASVNLALYCVCDKRFLVLAQKRLKLVFVWPFTLGREQVSSHDDDEENDSDTGGGGGNNADGRNNNSSSNTRSSNNRAGAAAAATGDNIELEERGIGRGGDLLARETTLVTEVTAL